MSRRISRSTPRGASWLDKSPLVKHNSPRFLESFIFESEPIKGTMSPDTTHLASSTEKKNSKKVRRKKIRHTEDLNVLLTEDNDSDVSSKTKSRPKKTKRIRLPSFLPPIDTLDENKKETLSSGSISTDYDNKENENKDRGNLDKVLRSSRKRGKVEPLKATQDEINGSKKTVSSENCSTDSDTKDNEKQSDAILEKKPRKSKRKKKPSFRKDLDQVDTADEDRKARPSLSGNSTDTDEKVVETKSSETMSRRSTRKKNSFMETQTAQSNEDGNKQQVEDNTTDASTLGINSSSRQTASKSTLRREGTFNVTLEKSYISRKTLDLSSSKLPSWTTGQEICDSVPMVETVDLTESIAKITPSPRKLRRTFDKDPIDNGNVPLKPGSKCIVNRTNTLTPVKKRNRNTTEFSSGSRQSSLEISSIRENKISTGTKSSFEISFNFNKESKQEQVLDNLNITKRESRNSNKKSSTGMQYSSGLEDETNNFVTLRRKCHSLMDFEAANSLNNSTYDKGNTLWRSKTSAKLDKAMEETNDVSLERKSVAKQPSPRKGILKSDRITRCSRNTTFEVADDSNETFERSERRSKLRTTESTPNKSQQVGAYRDIFDVVIDTPTVDLREMLIDNVGSFALATTVANESNVSNTFTIGDEIPTKTLGRGRSSSRKRWSQVEKTPIFDKMPPCSRNDSQLDANFSITKSVRFGTSPPTLSFAAQSQMEEKKRRAKKSVKIESPMTTPKMRLHSPLVMRKTPKPDFSASENSILASNCAYSSATLMSPPSSASTPFAKKKEVSLLHVVLTNEKNKAEKAIKSSSRVKMPNFRKIHEKQFEKMENIKELQERKAMRAQYLMSGCKIPSAKNTSGGEEIESRKKLLFSPVKTAELNKKDKKTAKSAVPKLVKPEFKKRASLEKKKNELKSKLPIVIKNLKSSKAGQLQTISQQSGITKNLSKPQQHLLIKRASLDKKKPERKPETKPLSRFGFKQGTQVTKESQIKAVATKSKLTVNRTEENRKNATAVRTNRRFELLMQFRGKK